jgi:hypothetical protein
VARVDQGTAPPEDSTGGSLYLLARSTSSNAAGWTVVLNDTPSGQNYQGTVQGRTLTVSVLPLASTRAAWVGVILNLSLHPSIAAKPMTLEYRFVTDTTVRSVVTTGPGVGVVNEPVAPGRWKRLPLNVLRDVGTLWPSIVAVDNAIIRIAFTANARSAGVAEGRFGFLHFDFDPAYDPLAAQANLRGIYAARFPSLKVISGSEDSLDRHFCRIGGAAFNYNYPSTPPPFSNSVASDQVAQIKAHGGVATFNHPFGTGFTATLSSAATQDSKRASTVARLLKVGIYGADAVETGYRNREHIDLLHHQQVFDAMVRNGFYRTAIGASDDHSGADWGTLRNRFTTNVWARSLGESDVLAAFRSGRAYVPELGSFAGSLDLSLEGVFMGQVSLRRDAGLATRQLTISADRLPAGASVRVVRGPVDYAGAGTPDSGASVVATLPASAFAGGAVGVTLDTRTSCYARVDVVDGSGTVIAFSNPVVQLRETPPASAPAIPADRLVTV